MKFEQRNRTGRRTWAPENLQSGSEFPAATASCSLFKVPLKQIITDNIFQKLSQIYLKLNKTLPPRLQYLYQYSKKASESHFLSVAPKQYSAVTHPRPRKLEFQFLDFLCFCAVFTLTRLPSREICATLQEATVQRLDQFLPGTVFLRSMRRCRVSWARSTAKLHLHISFRSKLTRVDLNFQIHN